MVAVAQPPDRFRLGREGGLFATADADVLAVLLHAFDQTPESLERVAAVVREEHPASVIFAPPLPIGTFSSADPVEIAAGLVRRIDDQVEARQTQPDGGSYRSIILIGHSAGAVMARKIWALAHGATPSAGIDPARRRPWARKIDRIVLLAAMNRGWMISSALDPLARLLWTFGTAWGHFSRFVLRREPFIFGLRRGAPFLTTTRLQCLTVADALRHDLPITVQLLGTADDYVAPTDNVDLATGQEFHYLEVTEATHRGIVFLDEGDGADSALQQFRTALSADRPALSAASLKKEDVFDLFEESVDDHDATTSARRNSAVEHVVFVVHGIRDRGFWTRRIARLVKKLARDRGQHCRSVTSTYGYFPMGPFLAPWSRRAKVEWLLDQYVTAKALYPDADFAYVGHSNGTYLLAKALQLCPAVRFRRVVFAGSVVQRRYDWTSLLQRPDGTWQVGAIVNYVATADWVVAVFPQGLERMRLQDLGGAGHAGFMIGDDARLTNVEHVVGGHGAALTRKNWEEMAEFVLGGDAPPGNRGTQPSATVARLGRWAPFLWAAIIVVVVGIGVLLLLPLGYPGWLLAVGFALYLSLLRVVATKA